MSTDFSRYLIATDLDGTFFGPKSAILENNVRAIRFFLDHGGTFAFASGRDRRVLEYVFPGAGELSNAPSILCGGAYLYDFQKKETFDESPMDQEKTLEIVSLVFEKFPGIGLSVHTDRGLVCPVINDRMEKVFAKYRPIVFHERLEDNRDLHWHKAMFSTYDTEAIRGVFELAASLDLGDLMLTSSSPNLAEFLSKDAGKEKKVRRLHEICGKEKTMICVGNEKNDLDMLLAADIAASPANAIDEVRAVSTFHLCDHSRGCIADLIDQLRHSQEK